MDMGRVGLALGAGIIGSSMLSPAVGSGSVTGGAGLLAPPEPSEVDIVFLGGGQGEAVPSVAVTATGNGVGAQLTSWGVVNGVDDPVHLHDAAVTVPGSAVQLHALVADESSSTPHMLLTGSIHQDRFLLQTWRVHPDGSLEFLDDVAYDPDPTGSFGRSVTMFALDDRTKSAAGGGDVSAFQVLAALVVQDPAGPDQYEPRQFDIDAASGALASTFGAPDQDVHDNPSIDVAYQSSRDEFVVAFRDTGGNLAHEYWSMAEDGQMTSTGLTTSGVTIDGRNAPGTTTNVVVEPTGELAMSSFGQGGLLSVLRPALETEPELVTWESRDVCDGIGCTSVPFRIARSTEDVSAGPGVSLSADPTLTDGGDDLYHPILSGGGSWGDLRGVTAVASGDVDGDGDHEIAVGRDVGDGLRYRVLDVQNGDWVALVSAGGSTWSKTRSITAMAMGDVDGDGDAELAMGRNPGSGMRYQVIDYEGGAWAPIFENGGKGWNKARGITAMAMGDIDNDGDDELAMGRNDGGGMRYQVIDYEGGEWTPVLKNGGEGWPTTRSVTALALGDVNDDFDDDLAIGRDAGSDWRWAVRAYAGGSWSTYTTEGEDWGSTRSVTALAVGDLHPKGSGEVAVGRNAGTEMRFEVYTREGGPWTVVYPNGALGAGPGLGVTAMAIGDGDGIGRPELAYGFSDGLDTRYKVVRFDVGDNEWKTPTPQGGLEWGATRHPSAFAFADIENDGDAELLVGRDAGSGFRYELLDQPTVRPVRGSVSDALIEANSGAGSGRLYRRVPVGGGPLAQNASVGKFLTLLLAVEKITAGPDTPNLDDDVLISTKAASVVGSHAGPGNCDPPEKCLQAEDTMKLDDLLAAMMMVSDNRAAYAIAEKLSGSKKAFVAEAAQRANEIMGELGVSPRFDEDCMTGGSYDPSSGLACFTHPAGSSLTTDQDLVTLWRYARQYPLFQEYATKLTLDNFCGTDADDLPKCLDPLTKFGTSQYPGLDGWKGGNGGHGPGFGIDFCVLNGGCLAAATTRLDRTMLVTLRQSGDLWGDHDRLVNWGYRKAFAPDMRASKELGLNIDFGLDVMTSENVALTASLDATRELKVCGFPIGVEPWTIGAGSCVTAEVTGLPDGATGPFLPTTVDVAELNTGLAAGDFLTGAIVVGQGGPALSLTGWRVGTAYEE